MNVPKIYFNASLKKYYLSVFLSRALFEDFLTIGLALGFTNCPEYFRTQSPVNEYICRVSQQGRGNYSI